jgi:hypothetical protein
MTDHVAVQAGPTRSRAIVAIAGVCALLLLGGCLSSARHDYLMMRANAPKPERALGTTLAEAEMSNVGPTRPPAALAGVHER